MQMTRIGHVDMTDRNLGLQFARSKGRQAIHRKVLHRRNGEQRRKQHGQKEQPEDYPEKNLARFSQYFYTFVLQSGGVLNVY
jgi:hypothetical protein